MFSSVTVNIESYLKLSPQSSFFLQFLMIHMPLSSLHTYSGPQASIHSESSIQPSIMKTKKTTPRAKMSYYFISKFIIM